MRTEKGTGRIQSAGLPADGKLSPVRCSGKQRERRENFMQNLYYGGDIITMREEGDAPEALIAADGKIV